MERNARQGRTLTTHGSMAAMGEAVANSIHKLLAHALDSRGHASLAVSGGTSPVGMYRILSRAILDWRKVIVVLVDERWVDEDHPASNARMVRQTLLQHGAAEANFLPLKTPHATPQEAQAELNQRLRAHLPLPLDAVVLGMGNDGHTASWFPHADGLQSALQGKGPAFAISAKKSEVTGDLTARMTLGLQALRSASCLHLMLGGHDKLAPWEKACADGPVEDMPVRALLDDEHAALCVHWAPKD